MERKLEGFKLLRRRKVTTGSAECREEMHNLASTVTGGHILGTPRLRWNLQRALEVWLKPLETETCSESKAFRGIIYDLLLFRFFHYCFFIPSNEKAA